MSDQPKVSIYGTSVFLLANVDAGEHNITPDMIESIFAPDWYDHAIGMWCKAIGVCVKDDVYRNMGWRAPGASGDGLLLTIYEGNIAPSSLEYTLAKHTVVFREYSISDTGTIILCSAGVNTEILSLDNPEYQARYHDMLVASTTHTMKEEEASNAQ